MDGAAERVQTDDRKEGGDMSFDGAIFRAAQKRMPARENRSGRIACPSRHTDPYSKSALFMRRSVTVLKSGAEAKRRSNEKSNGAFYKNAKNS